MVNGVMVTVDIGAVAALLLSVVERDIRCLKQHLGCAIGAWNDSRNAEGNAQVGLVAASCVSDLQPTYT